VQGTHYVLDLDAMAVDPPLPATFFATHPPMDVGVCGDNENAALFFAVR